MTQDSSAPSGFANSTKLACTTADTSIAADEITILGQSLEGQNVQAFAKGTSDAKPFVVSFRTVDQYDCVYRIYFDTFKFKDYGKLGNVNIEGLEEGARVEKNET